MAGWRMTFFVRGNSAFPHNLTAKDTSPLVDFTPKKCEYKVNKGFKGHYALCWEFEGQGSSR